MAEKLKARRIGPMKVRMPISQADATFVSNPRVAEDVLPSWPEGSLRLAGTWTLKHQLFQLRPILPGALRFIAEGPVPSLGEIKATAGHLTPATLKVLSQVTGTLVVQVQDATALKQYQEFGALEALGEAPTLAFFGPVRLHERFWLEALLDHKNGLIPGTLRAEHTKYPPGHVEWERHVAAGFVAGQYSPILRAADEVDDDQAARLAMPEIPVALDGSFELNIGLGWQKWRTQLPVPTSPPDQLEPVPVQPFFHHVARVLREPFLAAKGAQPIIVAMMDEQSNAEAWNGALRQRLLNLGFGALDGSTPLNNIIREFQIAAAGEFVAQGKGEITAAQLALRDFRDLQRLPNTNRYQGPISGRANHQTRRLIGSWERSGWRSPLIVVVFAKKDIEVDALPKVNAQPVLADIWGPHEEKDESNRMFAADFSRSDAGLEIGHKSLEFIGRYHKWTNWGGPGSQPPDYYRSTALAEVTPERLLALDTQTILDGEQANNKEMKCIASTFRVVRAVSEIECMGYLDQVNAYDGAGISIGLFHQSAASAWEKPEEGTELGGLAGFLQYLEKEGIAGADVFRPQGLTAQLGMNDPAHKAALPAVRGAYFKPLCLLDDRGVSRFMSKSDPVVTLPSWRSLYRWTRVGRSSIVFGSADWAMAIRRLARICETSFVSVEAIDDPRNPVVSKRTIGNVFTSELSIAWLLRWHVKVSTGVISRPKDVKNDQASEYLITAYKQAAAARPSTNDSWETELRKGLLAGLKDFQRKYPKHHKLDEDFDDIQTVKWEPPRPNPRNYALNLALRRCKKEADTFKRLTPKYDP